ncbi:conjugal transfer protein TraH [Orientia tsutsugamushi]|uniref:Conjugal transfer protein TraH n=1 Tax=Orientia tsutsugamushi TaxID=784 RepID=A0A2U3QS21_ORITS|nr:F pilus assembly TraH domain protein [Orientia tsutsugamushi str. UT76]KJV71922.1 F pilus assembly TraH domain protein [Orientia tsutsugamushi str. UT76]SPR03736.1 conjugal transfer protein TraH [Orientia tsutsugamushi]
MHDSIMSMTGTIVVTNNNVHFYDSLAQDEKSWISHLKGGESASIYSCDSVSCLHSTLATKYSNNVGNRYNQINFIKCATAMLISLN